jgi:protein O-GlcNAc transferase
MRADRIDIAIDTSMHLAGNRLLTLARKPAPVQVTWLAYTGGTGLDAMDYRLTDPHLDPPDRPNDAFYAEQSIRLPETFWCYDPIVPGPDVNDLPALRENGGRITFGSLNTFSKVNDVTLALWADVLTRLPRARARMIILCDPGSARERTLATLRSRGVAQEQIEFIARLPRMQYLLAHHRVDVILDTFPYNGHTTSFDALWMGVPVVSLCGDRTVARGGLCQMKNLGLADRFVAHSPEAFTQLAIGCANDLDGLSDLRATLRDRLRASPLMDAPCFARHFEHALRAMWRRWCARP